eukprot:gene7165-9664_t
MRFEGGRAKQCYMTARAFLRIARAINVASSPQFSCPIRGSLGAPVAVRWLSDMSEEIKVASPRAHVLVVEDSSVFREMQGLLLRQAGYAVSGHEHPHTALAAAKERKFDLVIIDYELPEMNGQQFMHELRKIIPDIAIIFVSGSLTLELAIQLSKQGVAGIFNKPANPKTLPYSERIPGLGNKDVPGEVYAVARRAWPNL